MARYATVALNLPVAQEFTYLVPDRLESDLVVGCRVRVMLGRRRTTGVVVALADECDLDEEKLRPIEERMGETPPLPAALLEFTRRMAMTYGCSWGTALDAAWPSSLKRRPAKTVPAVALAKDEEQTAGEVFTLEDTSPKRARVLRTVLELGSPAPVPLVLKRTGVSRSPLQTLVKQGWLKWTRVPQADELLDQSRHERAPPHQLVPEQRAAVDTVVGSLRTGRHATFLLHGVTGSGKTEVYLRILEAVRKLGRSAIILVPEISLTPQTVGRFLSRFPDVAVLHSSLTESARANQWLRLAGGRAQIVVGARSALFAPVRNLGLIVVDEEHESTFKQQQQPRYHAREMAVLRGEIERAAVVLGSATPSLEAWHAATSGRYALLSMPRRVGPGRLPRILTIDMRAEQPVGGRPPLISRQLDVLMEERLRAREQVLLFLNRRGFAPVLYCSRCGETVKCAHCDAAMTWHSGRGRLVCHHCLEERRRPELCPTCSASPPVSLGSGTERVEDWVRRRFPSIVVARMDSDTMIRRESYQNVLGAVRRGDIDVLVGTQMIAKGLDFPNVTLVGVVSADTGLFMPDFRAAERCFQILAQVSGRAGRGEREGLVAIQTLCPEAEPIARAAALDYEGFVEAEFAARRELGYPPYARLIRIIAESADAKLAGDRLGSVARELRRRGEVAGFQVLGPAPAPLARVRGRFRRHLLLKCPSEAALDEARRALSGLESESGRRLRFLVDVDPAGML